MFQTVKAGAGQAFGWCYQGASDKWLPSCRGLLKLLLTASLNLSAYRIPNPTSHSIPEAISQRHSKTYSGTVQYYITQHYWDRIIQQSSQVVASKKPPGPGVLQDAKLGHLDSCWATTSLQSLPDSVVRELIHNLRWGTKSVAVHLASLVGQARGARVCMEVIGCVGRAGEAGSRGGPGGWKSASATTWAASFPT